MIAEVFVSTCNWLALTFEILLDEASFVVHVMCC